MALQEEFESQGNFLFKYRSFLPISILVLGLWVFYVTGKGTNYEPTYYLGLSIEMIALLVGILGLLIRIYTVGFTPKNTSGRNTTEGQLADVLNTSGIYSIVRHPLYVGNFFMWLAIAILTVNFWFVVCFVFFYWVYYEKIMYAEEQFLRRKFGDTYLKWAENTPAFVPKFQLPKKAALTFSWKKILKKEKNGVFALFLLIFLFNSLGKYLSTGEINLSYDWMTLGTLISGGVYIIIKVLRDYTSILNEEGR